MGRLEKSKRFYRRDEEEVKMECTEQITKLKKILVAFKEERERHLKEATHFSGTKAGTYHLGSADALESVIKEIENMLHELE